MKPYGQNRNRSYYRHHRKRVILRKANITHQLNWSVGQLGRLAKGKIHCSCGMCSVKTRLFGFPKSEQAKLEGLKQQLDDLIEDKEF